jgi:hypothetical protein
MYHNQGWAKKHKNRENRKKNNRKNRTVKKNRLKFWNNQPVRFGFGFISLKLKKPNRTQTKKTGKNPSQTGKNRASPVFVLKTNRNWSVWTGFGSLSGFFKKIYFNLIIFLIKTKSNWKWSPLPTTLSFMRLSNEEK